MEGDALLLGGFLENFTFQSTPSVWRETSRRRTFPDSQQRISIHSLRMEGDFVLFEVHHITCYFNPLPPYGGRRLIRYPFSRIHAFQSTPSVWRETPYIWLTRLQLRNFNPLPPYGGRLHNQLQSTATTRFQSTPSVWRETRTQRQRHGERGFSIHSLRMEGDIFRNKNRTRTAYFNPLPPYGGRQHYAALVLVSADISIHSLRMEGDRASRTLMGISQYFNSLPPYGGRRVAQ